MGLIRKIYCKQKYEDEYVRLLPMIANESRQYIQKMSNSRVIPELARKMLADGIPESFTVCESSILLKNKDGYQYNSMQFKHMGLPDLQSLRKFSKEINDSICWHPKYKDDEYIGMTYITKFKDSLKQGGEFQRTNPDLFGIVTYNPDSYATHTHIPCIDECAVVGILLCRKMGIEYSYMLPSDTYKGDSMTFIRKYARTRSW